MARDFLKRKVELQRKSRWCKLDVHISSNLHLHIQTDSRLKINKNGNAELCLTSVSLVMNTVYGTAIFYVPDMDDITDMTQTLAIRRSVIILNSFHHFVDVRMHQPYIRYGQILTRLATFIGTQIPLHFLVE